jgi:microtubule-associated protein, RP/EB family
MFIIIIGYIIGLTAMQKGCYFTSRHDIVHWINHILGTSLATIEQLGSGSIYCQLLDAAYPGKVPLQKVKWKAYLEVDFIHNFKILQNCFEHLGITKYIEVHLTPSRYKDSSRPSTKTTWSSFNG